MACKAKGFFGVGLLVLLGACVPASAAMQNANCDFWCTIFSNFQKAVEKDYRFKDICVGRVIVERRVNKAEDVPALYATEHVTSWITYEEPEKPTEKTQIDWHVCLPGHVQSVDKLDLGQRNKLRFLAAYDLGIFYSAYGKSAVSFAQDFFLHLKDACSWKQLLVGACCLGAARYSVDDGGASERILLPCVLGWASTWMRTVRNAECLAKQEAESFALTLSANLPLAEGGVVHFTEQLCVEYAAREKIKKERGIFPYVWKRALSVGEQLAFPLSNARPSFESSLQHIFATFPKQSDALCKLSQEACNRYFGSRKYDARVVRQRILRIAESAGK